MVDLAAAQAKCTAEARGVELLADTPADLAAHVGDHDMGAGCDFSILGYVIANRTDYVHTLDGQPFRAGDPGFLDYQMARTGIGRKPRFYDRVVREETAAPWFYAVVTGNAVSAQEYFREQGFTEAFADSPVYVAVRPVEG